MVVQIYILLNCINLSFRASALEFFRATLKFSLSITMVADVFSLILKLARQFNQQFIAILWQRNSICQYRFIDYFVMYQLFHATNAS